MAITPPRVDPVTSPRNALLKDIRRAALRGELTPDGFMVAESFHLLEEALRSDCEIGTVIAAASVKSAVEGHVRGLKRVRVQVVDDRIFEGVSSTETTQGVIALVRPRLSTMDDVFRGRAMVVVLDGIQDPGNAGAIVRAAEAFGATGVVLMKGTVSPYNAKALRASAGSLFRLPWVSGVDADIVRAMFEQKRLEVYAAHPRGTHPLAETDLSRKFALVVGSEGRGVSEKLQSVSLDLRIPTVGVESLNAAMAAGVILYEASRQRMIRK
jgi:TrmH family RNA methyltransferase